MIFMNIVKIMIKSVKGHNYGCCRFVIEAVIV
jgi:hypothetical protein